MSPVPPLQTVTAAIVFGAVTCATSALFCQLMLSGYTRVVVEAVMGDHRQPSTTDPCSSIQFVCCVCWKVTSLGFVLLYVFASDSILSSESVETFYDRDQFLFLITLVLGASCFSFQRVNLSEQRLAEEHAGQLQVDHSSSSFSPPPISLLSRNQTEEWKGWMQLVILIYNYYRAEEGENVVRALVSSYVFMSTFGHFSFLYSRQNGEHTIARVMRVMWRLFFLAVLVSFSHHGTPIILYGACFLHAFYFFVVCGVIFCAKAVNTTTWGLRAKISVLSLGGFLLWDTTSGSNTSGKVVDGTNPSLWVQAAESWSRETLLHHWPALFGLIFALNLPVSCTFLTKLEASAFTDQIVGKSVLGTALLGAFAVWMFRTESNAYAGLAPLLTYIFFRNLTPWLRRWSNTMLECIGRTTLEMYVLHHHIWLSSNGNRVLVLLPGYPKMNFLLVTCIFFMVCRHVNKTTLFLRSVALPHDRLAICVRNLAFIGLSSVGAIGIVYVVRSTGLLSTITVGFMSAVAGLMLFVRILAISKDASLYRPRKMSYGAGLGVVVLLGGCWNRFGATWFDLQPVPNCDEAVLHGDWINVSLCDDSVLGMNRRQKEVVSIGTCEALVWGWAKSRVPTSCTFHQRHPTELLSALTNRNITFAGDSIVRHLYHASCRLLGDRDAGMYNTSAEKHSDYNRRYRKSAMGFRWAPYVGNISSVVVNIINQAEEQKPDLLVIGGGAWDRLHTYKTDVERQSLLNAVTTLKNQIEQLTPKIPVVWVSPTTMNSWALNTPEKRLHIREDQMSEFRDLYGTIGIYKAATFVLNGTSFTSSRVNESYDGVHYPLRIYDGGAQILANSYDWLIPSQKKTRLFVERGTEVKPNFVLGFVVLCFFTVAVFLFDSFFGLLHVVSILFVPSLQPSMLARNNNNNKPSESWPKQGKCSDHDDQEEGEQAAFLNSVG